MRIDHRPGNGKPQTEAAKASGNGGLSLFERVKDLSDLVRLDPDSGIADSNFDFVRQSVRRCDRYPAVDRCEFDAVLN